MKHLAQLTSQYFQKHIFHRPNLSKVIKNIGWLFLDRGLRLGLSLIVGVWLARYLGPEQFGLLNFAIAFVSIFGPIAGLGLYNILVRELVRDPSAKDNILATAAVLQTSGGFISYGIILAAIVFIRPDDRQTQIIVAVLGLTMLFKASEVATCWFESQVESRYIVWVQSLSALIFAALKIMLIWIEAPLMAFIWVMVAEACLVAALILRMLVVRGPGLSLLSANLARAKSFLLDGWPLILSGAAIIIYMKIDQIMLGEMLGNEAVGVYSAASRVSEVWYVIPVAVVASLFPGILESKARSEQLFKDRMQLLYRFMVWIAVAIALPMTFLSDPLIRQLFGEEYAGAGLVLAIHIWASVFVFLGVATSKRYIAENRQIFVLQRTISGALTNVFLNLFLIPGYGPLGAAIATVISYAVADLFFDLIQKETRGNFYMKVSAILLLRNDRLSK